MHVFTYGTLMFPEIWQAVVGRQFETICAALGDYQIFRVRGAVYPGIIQCLPDPQPSTLNSQPSRVPGVLYLDVDTDAIARLDRFEDDSYERRSITVACDDGRQLAANAYILPEESRHLLTDESWTAADFTARGDLDRFVARYSGFHRLD